MSETKHGATCPTCGGWTGRRQNGVLFPHQRYADGAGFGPGQPHELVQCEGSDRQPSEAPAR